MVVGTDMTVNTSSTATNLFTVTSTGQTKLQQPVYTSFKGKSYSTSLLLYVIYIINRELIPNQLFTTPWINLSYSVSILSENSLSWSNKKKPIRSKQTTQQQRQQLKKLTTTENNFAKGLRCINKWRSSEVKINVSWMLVRFYQWRLLRELPGIMKSLEWVTLGSFEHTLIYEVDSFQVQLA